jgi:hypothetical protein
MNEQKNTPSHQVVAMQVLAVVGFISLVAGSMWLAVYSTRYVPSVIGRIGTAVVYLGSVFTPAPVSSLSVVPTASTTIDFAEASSTLSTSVPTASSTPIEPLTTPVVSPKQYRPVAGTETSKTYQITPATTTTPVALSNGLSDFVVNINAIGYLATTSAESFIASSTVPNGSRPAVRFTIKNVGGSTSGQWRFSASIPTQTAYIYQSQPQQSLNPGDSIDYTLGFDQANKGSGQMISITANFDHAVTESNSNNNSAASQITILGS